MENVYIAAVGMIPFGKYPDESIKGLTGQVLAKLFKDATIASPPAVHGGQSIDRQMAPTDSF